MRKSTLVKVLVAIILVSACHEARYTEAWFNKTCQDLGYDMAVPVYWDDEPAGTNCCVMDGNRINCEDFYYMDDLLR